MYGGGVLVSMKISRSVTLFNFLSESPGSLNFDDRSSSSNDSFVLKFYGNIQKLQFLKGTKKNTML